MGGVLALSRAAELHSEIKGWLEASGFEDVTVAGKENEELNTAICDKKPSLVIIDSWFYQDGTPCRVGDLVKLFPKLNVAVISVHDFSVSHAPWFIWEGAKSYLSLWEGYGEFQRGLRIVQEGGQYISPKVQHLIDHCEEWPDTKSRMTKRRKECLVMLCCGLIPVQIGNTAYIQKYGWQAS